MRSDGCTWAPCFIIVCLHAVQQWPWISLAGWRWLPWKLTTSCRDAPRCDGKQIHSVWRALLFCEQNMILVTFVLLLLSPPASPPSTSSAETSHSDWPSDALTPQCLLLFLGLPVKYPLSQGSSSGCSLPCCFSHYWLASHSLFFFLFFIIVPGLFVNLRRVSTNQSNLLTKTSEERKAQFAPFS